MTFILACEGSEKSDRAAGHFTAPQLRAALLTLDDLPSGWMVNTSQVDTGEDDRVCGVGPAIDDDRVVRAEAAFTMGSTGPLLSQTLGFLPGQSIDVAEKLWKENSRAFEACTDFTTTSGTQTILWKVTSITLPNFGDDTFALRATSSNVPVLGTAAMELVFVRYGNLQAGIAHFVVGQPGIDSSFTEEMVRRADAKLKAVQ
jgi:hypothetical protein